MLLVERIFDERQAKQRLLEPFTWVFLDKIDNCYEFETQYEVCGYLYLINDQIVER